jgi:hypothetical protein
MNSSTKHPESTGMEALAEKAESPSLGLLSQFWAFIKYEKKYWLIPLLLVLLPIGSLVVLSSTAAAPFIYALF